jgi:hypothetical protein
VWGSTDPAGQFFNPYGYSSHPIISIDPDGSFILLLATAAFMRAAIIDVKNSSANIFSAMKAGIYAATGVITNWSFPGIMQIGYGLAQGIATTISTKGRAEGAFGLGFKEGLWDTWNEATGGFFSDRIGKRQGKLRGEAHVRAYDLTGEAEAITRAEAIHASKEFASYTWQGRSIRYGADIEGRKAESRRYTAAYVKRLYAEGNIDESNRIAYMFNIRPQWYNSDPHKQGVIRPQLGHAFLGHLGSHYAVYDLFETYGEPFEEWNEQDKVDDWGFIRWLQNEGDNSYVWGLGD